MKSIRAKFLPKELNFGQKNCRSRVAFSCWKIIGFLVKFEVEKPDCCENWTISQAWNFQLFKRLWLFWIFEFFSKRFFRLVEHNFSEMVERLFWHLYTIFITYNPQLNYVIRFLTNISIFSRHFRKNIKRRNCRNSKFILFLCLLTVFIYPENKFLTFFIIYL